jgi:hypothetical protein
LITALTSNADRNTERIIAALEQWQPSVVTAREVLREVRVEPPDHPLIHANSRELTGELKPEVQRIQAVEAISPRDATRDWLRAYRGTSIEMTQADLAILISHETGIVVSQATVARVLQESEFKHLKRSSRKRKKRK